MPKLLIVDDDPELCKQLSDHFNKLGFLTETCQSGEDALQLLSSFHYDLIVQDWNLPGISGDEVCRRFRKRGGETPVIFLTGNGDISFKELGLDSGAEDFVVKPFDLREITARVRAILKRRPVGDKRRLVVDDLTLNPEDNTVTVGTKSLRLSAKEVSMLAFLIENANRAYSPQQLLQALWPSDSEVTTGAVRVAVKALRDKLAEAGKADLIETVDRSGYTIRG